MSWAKRKPRIVAPVVWIAPCPGSTHAGTLVCRPRSRHVAPVGYNCLPLLFPRPTHPLEPLRSFHANNLRPTPTHCHSCQTSPAAFGFLLPTSEVFPLPPISSLNTAYCSNSFLSEVPAQTSSFPPLRAAYSHSDSVGRR